MPRDMDYLGFTCLCVSSKPCVRSNLALEPRRRSSLLRARKSRGRLQAHGSATAEAGPDPETLEHVLNVAKDAAKAAGEIIMKNIGAESVKTKLNAKDLLTEIDPMVEKEIHRHVEEVIEPSEHRLWNSSLRTFS